ncbi:4-pyridoxate dehydrogenase-like isoform X2 [Ornithodoros turicata]|uniref:4-pyridoxate dehydrogenase-like isoform X2 n=1 Tax=Ornithodoros turicata TaxID=34597 RepID=UPI00313A241E
MTSSLLETLQGSSLCTVGGGSAGSVVANRLSANPKVSVLLIEAGRAEDATIRVPLYAMLHLRGPYDWNYKTVPQEHACLGYKDRRSVWARGKGLGGSSLINFMMYVRGNKRDYDLWSENGATGWSYEEVLPYFKSIETLDIPEHANNGYRGDSGELPISFPSFHTLVSDAFLEGCKELGYKYTDYNGASQTGYSRVQFNIKNGHRYSAARAFLEPIVKERPNLHITLDSMATKIHFKGKTAVGVHFEKNGAKHFVRAKKEVILSAGAIASPQLLMLSGVGPNEELRKHNIDVVADLPVGKNLQDHIFVGGVSALTEENHAVDTRSLSAITSYAYDGAGPLAIPGAVEVLAFMSSSFVNETLDYPDIEHVLFSATPSAEETETFLYDLGYTYDLYSKYFLPRRGKFGFMICPVLNRLKSRGEITLNTTNPYDHPIIDPKYFTHPDDVEVAIQATKRTLQFIETKAMKAIGAKLWDIPFPYCVHHTPWGDEYLECVVRHLTQTAWHYCGTCAMGVDDKAVVDPRLRVRGGVKNLRVIDASIMPEIVSGNINAATLMIGAKGAALVLEDNNLNKS